jgi:uncharacterized tellurite resistance protein B-like protein
MGKLERLYDVFGDLLYVVAKADGIVQKEEVAVLERVIAKHPWAKEIEWAFNYDLEKNTSVDYLYNKVIDFCHEFGPNPEYKFLVDVLEEVANASGKINKKEMVVINKFTTELTNRFKKDLDKLENRI